MPKYTLKNGITYEFDYINPVLLDKPKENNSKYYYPMVHTDINGEDYYDYVEIKGQTVLDTVRAIKNLTNLNEENANKLASIYFRNLNPLEFKDLYGRIATESIEVSLDRQVEDNIIQALEVIKRSNFHGNTYRNISFKMGNKDLTKLLKEELIINNKREINKIDLDNEYPDLMDKVDSLIEENNPNIKVSDINVNNKYYIKEETGKKKVLVR